MSDHPIPLKDYLKTCTQAQLAKALGVTQGAISKMVRTGRNVFVGTRGGKLYVYEVKEISAA